MAHPFDPVKLELSGEPAVVAESVVSSVGSARAWFSVSADGRVLALRIAEGGGMYQLSWFGRDGEHLGSVGSPGDWVDIHISPDEERVAAVQSEPETGLRAIWTIDLTSGIPTRLTLKSSNAYFPDWSPDGSQVAYVSDPQGTPDIYVRESTPTGNPKPLLESNEATWMKSWSPDGRWIAYELQPAGGNNSIWFLPLSGDPRPFPVVQTEFSAVHPEFSPDGRWLAYVSNESGEFEVYVMPIPKGSSEPRPGRGQRVSTEGASAIRWRGDGNELFYAAPGNTIMSVEISEGESFRAAAPMPLFRACEARFVKSVTNYDVSADGSRFLISCPVGRESSELHVWVNWGASLER